MGIFLDVDDFRYPSSEERIEAAKDYPVITSFSFDESKFDEAISQHKPLAEASRLGNLPEWNKTLRGRLQKLRETYFYMMTSYNRLFFKHPSDYTQNRYFADSDLFNYYSEIFYYYFFSSREIIGHILRVYYNVDIDEYKFYMNNDKFTREIAKHPTIENALKSFNDSTKSSSDIRNSFTHRFTPNYRDFRSKYDKTPGMEGLMLGFGNNTTQHEIVKNVKESLQSLKTLMDVLVLEIKT